MRLAIVLNRDGGTLKTADAPALGERLAQKLAMGGHAVVVRIAERGTIAATLAACARDFDGIVIGGGDGSVSLAASLCFERNKTLGVLPAGTMNFFARSLGMPLDLDAACDALARATVEKVDCGSVNEEVFIHQVSIGVQARMVEYRNALDYGSRAAKILASVRAGARALLRPPSLRARIAAGGHADEGRFSIIAVSNNVFEEGLLPYAPRPDECVLGIYTAPRLSLAGNLALARDLLFRRWTSNEHFLSQSTTKVRIDILSSVRGRKMTIDGELKPLPRRLDIVLHRRALSVLKPEPDRSRTATLSTA